MKSFTSPETQSFVDERRAAVLTGLSLVRLRKLSRQARLGHLARNGAGKQRVFTYQELHLLCRIASNGAR